jgi:drug/metabolite transporter (DMT)-like permease
MLGALLGLISAAAFGGNSIITRRGMMRVSPNYFAVLTVFTGPVFFSLIAAVMGEFSRLKAFSWQVYFFFAIAGIGHFALGRNWAYRSIQLIGATRANIVTSLNPIVTTVLAVIILRESISVVRAMGILFALTGPLLMLLKEEVTTKAAQLKGGRRGKELDRPTLYKGILCGAGTMIFWGSSSIFIKLGLEEGGSPLAGSLIAYWFASLAILPSVLLRKEQRRELLHAEKASLRTALISGLTTNTAQLLRYVALANGSAIVVSLMLQTQTLWVLIFAFLFYRSYESFSRWVLMGSGFLIIGTLLVLIS